MPSPKDIQKKLDKPLGALPNPKELADKAKVTTPNAENLVSKVSLFLFPCQCGDLVRLRIANCAYHSQLEKQEA